MITKLGAATLKSGEQLTIQIVTPPDEEWDEQILPFLGHKPTHYRAHIEAAFANRCDTLETRFYIGVIDGRMVGNIMTVEADGIGILGHVQTSHGHRRKGVASSIMSLQMEHFRGRAGRALLLGTGYDSPPYHIYRTYGFADLPGGRPGLMQYTAPEFAEQTDAYFQYAGPREPIRAAWRHWPLAAFLVSRPQPKMLRSITFGTWGVDLLEGPFCKFMFEHGQDTDGRAAVIAADSGAVAGIGTCVPDARWKRDIHLLDLIAHPGADPDDLRRLVESILPGACPTQCYADARDVRKIAVLKAAGFRLEATIERQYSVDDVWQSVVLFSHGGDV